MLIKHYYSPQFCIVKLTQMYHPCSAYLHHDLDLSPAGNTTMSSSAPQQGTPSPLRVDPVSGVYIGMELEDDEVKEDEISFRNLNGMHNEPVVEEEKVSKNSPTVKNIKKKLLTIRSWPTMIRKTSK